MASYKKFAEKVANRVVKLIKSEPCDPELVVDEEAEFSRGGFPEPGHSDPVRRRRGEVVRKVSPPGRIKPEVEYSHKPTDRKEDEVKMDEIKIRPLGECLGDDTPLEHTRIFEVNIEGKGKQYVSAPLEALPKLIDLLGASLDPVAWFVKVDGSWTQPLRLQPWQKKQREEWKKESAEQLKQLAEAQPAVKADRPDPPGAGHKSTDIYNNPIPGMERERK
ncbi:unnamed protein product [marine sediment metagenome]|uniref:Uncharacterized protein n=1 Tax=marine sediment metagenome TaxID=412755 RepID=X1JGY3_9ZZZZ